MFASFIVTLRESLEAALIISLMAAVLTKTGRRHALRYLFSGVLIAVIVSFVLGTLIFKVSGELEGMSEQLFEGVAAYTAAIVLTYMIFWMSRNARNVSSELRRKMENSLSKENMVGIGLLAFIAVFREGAETVLFLSTLFIADPAGTVAGAAIGIVSITAFSILAFRGILKIDTQKFFAITGFILIIFSAGLVASGTHEFIESGIIPAGIEDMWDLNPSVNPNGTYPLFHEKGAIGSLFASLFGYNGNPDLTEIAAYLLYWIIIGGFFWKESDSRNRGKT